MHVVADHTLLARGEQRLTGLEIELPAVVRTLDQTILVTEDVFSRLGGQKRATHLAHTDGTALMRAGVPECIPPIIRRVQHPDVFIRDAGGDELRLAEVSD